MGKQAITSSGGIAMRVFVLGLTLAMTALFGKGWAFFFYLGLVVAAIGFVMVAWPLLASLFD